jgi:hypothetical protein
MVSGTIISGMPPHPTQPNPDQLRELQLSQIADLKKLEQAYLREAFRGDL